MTQRHLLMALASAAAFAGPRIAAAQCTTIDFDGPAVGTTITTFYSGVTFSAEPGSCPHPVLPVIVTPTGGTTSGTQGLSLETGCPDFSPDFLRMVFDNLQRKVTFTLGEQAGGSGNSFWIEAFDSGGGSLGLQTITTGAGTRTLVIVGSDAGPTNIARIEVESTVNGLFETIDDLSFGFDSTPPTAELHGLPFLKCLCPGVVSITGVACDADGAYGFDRLEYRSVNAAPGDPWTLIGSFASPLCAPGTLYTWDTTGVSHGNYYLRLTVENACGLVTSDTRVVHVDQQYGTVAITSPGGGDTVCGMVELWGTVSDHCPDYYTIEIRAVPGGQFAPIDPNTPTYTGEVHNCRFLWWDSTQVPDGDYEIRVTGVDDCGHVESATVGFTVDNSGTCGCAADLNNDGFVNVLDLLIMLTSWGACPL